MTQPAPDLKVEQLMRDLEHQIRRDRRARLLARGGAADYGDPDVFRDVEALFRRVLNARDRDALLLPELFDDPQDYALKLHLQHSSRRPIVGPLVVFVRQRILLPMLRWLYEYSLDNFRRQQRVNRLLFALVEELAIENARLRKAAGLGQEETSAADLPGSGN
jgi:hypothetical protein